MTAPTHPSISPKALLYLGSALLLVHVASGTVLDDMVVALSDPSQEQLGWLFTALGILSTLSIALGTAVLAAAIVLYGMQSSPQQDDGGRKWSIQLPRNRPVFLSDAVVGEVEDYAKTHDLATDEALDRLVLSGLRTPDPR